MNEPKDRYDFRKIEDKWERVWAEKDLYKAIDFDKKSKKYVLVEFPYPSGEGLHIGHAFTMTGADVLARKTRMSGYNVLFPMGWDAFGLPTENYAIKTGIHPAVVTQKNTGTFRTQMKKMAFSFDWDREINTTDPNYYKWTQWIFLQWYKKGLVHKAEMPINWCPSCRIGLANEEVINGKCERCGAETFKKDLDQWIVKITDYAERLLDGLKNTAFIEKVKAAQVNWIGRSEGAEIEFRISKACCSAIKNYELRIKVFTTRPDTLYGATFMVLAPEHELVAELLNSKLKTQNSKLMEDIRNYIENARKKSEMERTELSKEKTGVFSGFYAINPANEKEIPIWISDFVLSTYGTGAIMAVPAHDERDWQFAKKFFLPIVPVIEPPGGWNFDKSAYTDVETGKTVNSPEWNNLTPAEAIKKATEWVEKKKIGSKSVSYHLRDWIFSRQHYWGEPIPIIHCEKCGVEPVPEKDLPVELPKVENYQPTDTGASPLANIKNWVETTCPKCGGPAQRETDTMPNWAGSDWYYLAYCFADKLKNTKFQNIFEGSENILNYWLPVDVYVGGDEHNTLHLLYSRFTYQFLRDIGAVPKKITEPYFKRLSHGVILGSDGQRMSKSKGNVINPDEVVEAFGVDSLRLYLAFMGPFEGTMVWSQESLEGCSRFVKRVWNLVTSNVSGGQSAPGLLRKLHQTIKKVGEDIEEMKFNTAVASMMEFINAWQATGNLSKKDAGSFLQILAPFAPYITEELWEKLGNKFSIHQSVWPEYDSSLIVEETVTIAIQVNGKLRSTIEVKSGMSNVKSEIEELTRKDEKIQKHFKGAAVKKVIFVPGKLINFVV